MNFRIAFGFRPPVLRTDDANEIGDPVLIVSLLRLEDQERMVGPRSSSLSRPINTARRYSYARRLPRMKSCF
jgi:hypothetical protein